MIKSRSGVNSLSEAPIFHRVTGLRGLLQRRNNDQVFRFASVPDDFRDCSLYAGRGRGSDSGFGRGWGLTKNCPLFGLKGGNVDIKNMYDVVIYTSALLTIKDAIIEAVSKGADQIGRAHV